MTRVHETLKDLVHRRIDTHHTIEEGARLSHEPRGIRPALVRTEHLGRRRRRPQKITRSSQHSQFDSKPFFLGDAQEGRFEFAHLEGQQIPFAGARLPVEHPLLQCRAGGLRLAPCRLERPRER